MPVIDMEEIALTEFEAIDVQTIKGVREGANGFPILMMKGLAPEVAKGARDCPECSKNYDADHTGSTCENCGTDLPDAPAAKAADGVDCPTCKGDGKIMGGKRDCPDCDASGSVTPAKAKSIAAKSVTAPMQLAVPLTPEQEASWTPELVAAFKSAWDELVNPIADDTGKPAIAPEGTTVDTVTQETGGLTKAVEEAIAKATAPLQKRVDDLESSNKALDAELAKVKATPVPSGLVLSRNVQVKQPGTAVNEDELAKAARFRELAETVTDRVMADGYRKLARDAEAKAVTTTS